MIIYAKSCKEESTFEVMLKCFLGEAVSMISSQCKMQFCQAVMEYVLPDLWEVTRMQGNCELPWVKMWFWLFECGEMQWQRVYSFMSTESDVWHGSTAYLSSMHSYSRILKEFSTFLFPDPLLVYRETRTPINI